MRRWIAERWDRETFGVQTTAPTVNINELHLALLKGPSVPDSLQVRVAERRSLPASDVGGSAARLGRTPRLPIYFAISSESNPGVLRQVQRFGQTGREGEVSSIMGQSPYRPNDPLAVPRNGGDVPLGT